MTIEQYLVVIPSQSSADGPVLQPDLILHKNGLLKVRTVPQEAEVNRRAIMKSRRIVDVIVEVFIQKRVV